MTGVPKQQVYRGRSKWPPGKLHDDMEKGRKEVFRLGNWSIFAAGGHLSVTNADWDSFVLHCASWEQWEAIREPMSVNTWIKNETVTADTGATQKQELKRKHCNTNLIPHSTKVCPGCGTTIPHEIVALWTLQNFEKIQEVNSE